MLHLRQPSIHLMTFFIILSSYVCIIKGDLKKEKKDIISIIFKLKKENSKERYCTIIISKLLIQLIVLISLVSFFFIHVLHYHFTNFTICYYISLLFINVYVLLLWQRGH